ncbi:M43 family zinc metalloprotease [Haliscomenobacter hydrossis]|uniref:Secretion system C-terminal sorting domain-containing protein n=1 Tax=Haliscomenobacter hydrossis (strain ATCC 27775 / DSM 1100 / LMG 10767 / O) TaxID=760192 RepID=F4L6P8_HALH1|nr:M43 family zinc metalloprotease [Haliscomenobacter hydrossis]AEE50879.1 hypothetical protein Halhy_3016 [Haliscomenobacter hydrossis DSM 1100]
MKSRVFKFSSFTFLILLTINSLNAQSFSCGTVASPNHAFTIPPSSATSNQNNYNLPIHFYIITNQGTLPGLALNPNYNLVKHIRESLNFANTAFSSANMSFYPSAFTFYESSALFDAGDQLNSLYNTIHDNDAINVYIVNSYSTFIGRVGQAAQPLASVPINNVLSIRAISAPNLVHVLAHELGHYFNLDHTFRGTGGLSNPESDCTNQGDKICDTPQEPDFDIQVDCGSSTWICTSGCFSCSIPTCTTTHTVLNQSRTFTPDKKNIMGYNDQCFPDHFSLNQKEKMYNELIYNTYRAFLIQGSNPPSVPLPSENAYVYRTNNSGTSPVVSQFGSMPIQLSKTGVSPVTSTTLSTGGPYEVDRGIFLPQNITATIAPTRNGTGYLVPSWGLSLSDLIKIQQHILGTTLLPKPYAWIAADVTNNGLIQDDDKTQIQQVILGNISSFPSVPSWRMVPVFALQDPVFSSEFNSNPFTAIWTMSSGIQVGYNLALIGGTKTYFDDLEINLNNPNINQSSTFSFQAIKSGDVNFSAQVNSANTFRNEDFQPDLRTTEKYRLQSSLENCLEAGKSYSVSIAAQGNNLIYGYQLGIKFDPSHLEISGVDKGSVNYFSLDNFNLKKLKEGEFRTVWLDFEKNEKIRVSEKKDLFKMIVNPRVKVCNLDQILGLNDQTLENLFYDENSRLIDLELTASAQELKKDDINNDILLNVFPNPTSGEINFEISVQSKAKVNISLRDSFGKTVTLNQTVNAGSNKVTLTHELRSLSSGIIYYTIQLSTKAYSGTFFKI